MINVRDALKNEFSENGENQKSNSQKALKPETPKKPQFGVTEDELDEFLIEKKKAGRPAAVHETTKIHLILESRGMTRKDLFNLIRKKYPDEPISPDAVSRIVSGSRKHYTTQTLFRLCGALGLTPNQILDYENEIR